VTNVKIHGHQYLPDDISPDRLAAGISIVGRMLGINGTIDLYVRKRKSKTMGQTNPTPEDRRTILIWPKAIALEIARSERWTTRRLWAWIVAHELVHLSQIGQWTEIKESTREAWAEALEPVLGPIIENELDGV
jgi:hypothetical protein